MSIAAFLMLVAAPTAADGPPPGVHQAVPSDFDFANAYESPCIPTRTRRDPDPAFAEACKQWSEPQYFHGIWEIGFEVSNFTFMGKMECFKMQDRSCIDLIGDALPKRPPSDCNREYELKFIGRRTPYAVYGGGGPGSVLYVVKVDKVVSARLLPAPYNWQCPGILDAEGE